VTASVPGFVLVTVTGYCQLSGSPMAVALEVGLMLNGGLAAPAQNQALVSNVLGESPSFRSVAFSRSFEFKAAGSANLFVNAQRTSGSGVAVCPVNALVFFSTSQLP